MAAHPVVIVDDEILERLPHDFKSDPRYQRGAILELVPVPTALKLTSGVESPNWRSLQGALAKEGQTVSATDIKREEREWELAHDERKFGIDRPKW